MNVTAIFPADAIRKAVSNLKKYCCSNNNLIDATYCADVDFSEKKFPESPYLYDHLLDVGFRRLDAFPDAKSRYTLTPDALGQERRTFITQAGEDKEGTTSKVIMEKYNALRNSKISLPASPSESEVNGFIENYNNADRVSLYDKYLTLCEIAKRIYDAIRKNALNADTSLVIDP